MNNTRAFEKLMARLRTQPAPNITAFPVARRPTPSPSSTLAANATWHPPTRVPSPTPSPIPAGVSAAITAINVVLAIIRCSTNTKQTKQNQT